MNTKLVEHGIYQENSHIRAHVTLEGERITVYRTDDMRRLIEENNYPQRNAMQPGVDYPTALGYLVPIVDIQPQYILRSECFPWSRYNVECENDCGKKGRAAVLCVKAAIRANKFPLWVCGIVNEDREIDIQGTDIIVSASRKIQVKHDLKAYPKEEGGTGNLFIQTEECNPLGIH